MAQNSHDIQLLPVTQADIELLARIHEAGGNNAAAFTLRQIGAVGCVLETQAQLIASHRISSSETETRLRAALEFYAKPRTYKHPPTGGLAVAARPIDCDLGERARAALQETPK